MSIKTVPVLILLLFFVVTTAAQELLTSRAADAYLEANYAEAVELFERIVLKNPGGEAWFNLALSYIKTGDTGRAMLSFLRAEQYLPRSTEVQLQIARLRAARTDAIGTGTDPLDQIDQLFSTWLTYSEQKWGFLLSWLIFFLALAVKIRRKASSAAINSFTIITLLALTVIGSSLLLRYYTNTFRPAAVVLDDSVTVYSGPGEDYLALYTLHAAAEIRAVEHRAGWVRFVLADQRTGWIVETSLDYINTDRERGDGN